MNQRQDPIVIFGAPRSGTTYVSRILNAHPEVQITHEIRLFTWVNRSLNVIPKSDEVLLNHREEFLNHLRAIYPDMIRAFYLKKWPRGVYWGDKNPHYADAHNQACLDTILELFPGARFVHVVRDGRDVVASLVRKGWASFETAHTKWVNNVDVGSDFARRCPSDQFVEVRYEKLIEKDVAIGKWLLERLDIPVHPRVVEFCLAQQTERTPFSDPTRDLAAGAERSDWSRVLDEEQRRRSLGLLGGHLIKYGYETQESLSRLARA